MNNDKINALLYKLIVRIHWSPDQKDFIRMLHLTNKLLSRQQNL